MAAPLPGQVIALEEVMLEKYPRILLSHWKNIRAIINRFLKLSGEFSVTSPMSQIRNGTEHFLHALTLAPPLHTDPRHLP